MLRLVGAILVVSLMSASLISADSARVADCQAMADAVKNQGVDFGATTSGNNHKVSIKAGADVVKVGISLWAFF